MNPLLLLEGKVPINSEYTLAGAKTQVRTGGPVCCDPVGVTKHVPGRKCLPAVHVGGVERGPMDAPFAQHRHLVQVPPTTVDIQARSLTVWPHSLDARSTPRL